MTTQRTLASLKDALQQPFAPETIGFLPKEIHQENGKTVCLALPYANKRVYEDRLNELAFGEWSTPYVPPFAQGNKLILPVTVVILGVAHTDYGEEYFTITGKGGNTREDDNTATEAYSQAFRRACAQFLLGRYLYDLRKLTLPYDPKSRQIAVSKAEQIAWVEKLYMECGLKPRSVATPQRPGASPSAPVAQNISVPLTTTATPPPPQQQAKKTVPIQSAATTPPSVAQQKAPAQSAAAKVSQTTPQPTTHPRGSFLDWVAAQVERDPERIQGICTYYQVQTLEKLSTLQRNQLTRRLRTQASQRRQKVNASHL
ncbi:MAG: hypothetical protein H0V70_04450 [Ktedonobacteraceae bacterium]|nr:hypothetical protein [Ktedonobacteraceae bacterium]